MPNTRTIGNGYYDPRALPKQPRKRFDYSPCEDKRLARSLKNAFPKRSVDALIGHGSVKHSPYRVSRKRAKVWEFLERDFNVLAQQWRDETRHLSMSSDKANNFAYQQIIGMGPRVLPLIFRELNIATSDWFWALRAITRDKAPVIPPEDRGRVRKITEIWLDWGKRHGYVSG
jgi:hypothetical protein